MTPTPSPTPTTTPHDTVLSGLISVIGTNLSSTVVIAALTTGIVALAIAWISNRRDYPQDYIKLERETLTRAVRQLSRLHQEIVRMPIPLTAFDTRLLNRRLSVISEEVHALSTELRVVGAGTVSRAVGFYAIKLDQHIDRWHGGPASANVASQQRELERALDMQLGMIETRSVTVIDDGGRMTHSTRAGFTYILWGLGSSVVALIATPTDTATWGIPDWFLFVSLTVVAFVLLVVGSLSLFSRDRDAFTYMAPGLTEDGWPGEPDPDKV